LHESKLKVERTDVAAKRGEGVAKSPKPRGSELSAGNHRVYEALSTELSKDVEGATLDDVPRQRRERGLIIVVPPQNPIRLAIVDVSALGVKLA
jgi:hypothetical protein